MIDQDDELDDEGEIDEAEGAAVAPPSGSHTLTVSEDVAGARLDRFLADRLAGLSRARIQALIRKGQVQGPQGTTTDPGAKVRPGQSYEITGPEVLTFRQLMQVTLATIGRRRLLLPVPWSAARMLGMVLGVLPKPLLTADQVELLKSDNVASAAARAERRTLEGLGVTPRSIESIVPGYLYRFRKAGQFTAPSGIPE